MSLSTCGNQVSPQGKEIIQHGTALFPLACYEEDLSSHFTPWHWHDEFEFIVATHGDLNLKAGGDAVTIACGDGAFVNAGVLHTVEPASQTTVVRSVVFHPRLAGGSMDSIFWQRLVQLLLQESACRYFLLPSSSAWQNEILHCFHAAWESVVSETDDYENLARYQLSRALRLLNLHCPVPLKKPSRQEQMSAERIKTMLHFIEEHYAEELTVARIAQSASVSGSVCLRTFRRCLGTTPIQYLKQFRLEKAANLLRTTDMHANDVGMECGFFDSSYFTKAFREAKGCTPGEYQRLADG